jgi:hypothetical protein
MQAVRWSPDHHLTVFPAFGAASVTLFWPDAIMAYYVFPLFFLWIM